MPKLKLPNLSGVGDTLIKYADEYWEYWFILLIIIVGFGIYIIWFAGG